MKGKAYAVIVAGLLIGLLIYCTIPRTGTLTVRLTDAPVNVTHLNVEIDSFEVSGKGNWTDVPFANAGNTVQFDLLALQNVSALLAVGNIPVGNYSKMRMGVASANVTWLDGSVSELTVPPNKIDVILNFEIKPNETTEVLIDMDVDWVAISSSYNLKPVLKATVQ